MLFRYRDISGLRPTVKMKLLFTRSTICRINPLHGFAKTWTRENFSFSLFFPFFPLSKVLTLVSSEFWMEGEGGILELEYVVIRRGVHRRGSNSFFRFVLPNRQTICLRPFEQRFVHICD